MKILGVHFGHDSNAALISGGKIIAAVSEERFNRVKHSSDLPIQSIEYCLKVGNASIEDFDVIALSGQNLHEDFNKIFDNGKEGFPVPSYTQRYKLSEITKILLFDHHLCHASAGFHLAGLNQKSLILVSDGVGDDCSLSIWDGAGGRLQSIQKYPSFGSLGWFYSNITEALGWIHGDGEGKTMALAPSGDPDAAMEDIRHFAPGYAAGELSKPHDFGDVGNFRLRGSNQWFLNDARQIKRLFEKHSREDVAAAAQKILEDEHIKIVRYWMRKKEIENLCLSGGVFLNILLNRKIANLPECKSIYITPDPGDSGLALGAALAAVSEHCPEELTGKLETIYLGPEFSNDDIRVFLDKQKLDYDVFDEKMLLETAAGYIAGHKCVGWFQGRMEMGPRALGNRSILMRSSRSENKDYVNENVKFRERFRPFCPTLLEEDRDQYVTQNEAGKYMILAFESPDHVLKKYPAVAHVDTLIRPQILNKDDNPLYHGLIKAVQELTGESIVLNTSFNIKGEPIVCTPSDAVRCFYSTGMDVLIMGNCILKKNR